MEHSEDQAGRPVAVSSAVVRRLPRYYRYLQELIAQGRTRISSGELSALMNVTASQIRQDLNCFGGFGQQGYGYNVSYLFAKISEILAVGEGFNAVIIGAGDLGRALVHLSMFEKRGVDIIAMFDTGEGQAGNVFAGVRVLPLTDLEDFCAAHQVDIGVITCPKDLVKPIAERLAAACVRGLWNYMGVELGYAPGGMVVENVHLGDSLMILNYEIASRMEHRAPREIAAEGTVPPMRLSPRTGIRDRKTKNRKKNMSVRINYEYDAVTIPGKAVPALERAGATDIRLLMALCTRADLREVPETDLAAFATAIGVQRHR